MPPRGFSLLFFICMMLTHALLTQFPFPPRTHRLYPYSYYFSSKKGVDCSSLDYPFPQASQWMFMLLIMLFCLSFLSLSEPSPCLWGCYELHRRVTDNVSTAKAGPCPIFAGGTVSLLIRSRTTATWVREGPCLYWLAR